MAYNPHSPLRNAYRSPARTADAWKWSSDVSSPAVTPFSFQTETTTLTAAFGTPPTTNRKRTIDRAIRRLKSTGIWTKARWLMFVGADTNASWKNWKTPAEAATEVGTMTFVADQSYAGALGLNYLDLGIKANVLSQNDIGMYLWCQTGHMAATAGQTGSIMGVIDVSSNGLSMIPLHTSSGLNMRLAGGSFTTLGTSEGFGLHGASRSSSANFTSHINGVLKITQASTSATLPNLNIYVGGLNNNGSISNGNVVTQSFLYLGTALTETESRNLTGIVGEYLESVRYGEYYNEEVGVGASSVTVDFAVYGLTGPGVMAAVAYKRANPADTVAIIGGWRDRFTFGMAGGGLGFTDADAIAGYGGLPRWVVTQCNTQEGKADTTLPFLSKRFNRVMKTLLNDNGIKVYLTNGVATVTKPLKIITSITTTDYRTITASQWHDASYELDLYRVAGLTYSMGREAAGASTEANNGVRSVAGSAAPQDHIAADLIVNPRTVAGSTPTGLGDFLPGIHVISSTFSPGIHTFPVVGTADSLIPAYNFRMTYTTTAAFKVPLSQSAPTGYSAANYELHMRWLDAAVATGNALTMADFFKQDNVQSTGRYDLNNKGILSTDHINVNQGWATMTYAQREVVWKAVYNHIAGIFYLLQYSGESRVTGTLQSEARTWGACSDHYYSPHENDNVFDQPQLYVRECIRAASDVTMTATHMVQADGATPTLGDHTVSVASYGLDSHSVWRVAYESSAGVWETRAEGGMLIGAGGANNISPLPYEVFVPKAAECTNLTFSFGGSFTHAGFGSSRMELAAMQTGYSMGWASALAKNGTGIVQNVVYATLRTALLASPVLSGEVAPVLPQTT